MRANELAAPSLSRSAGSGIIPALPVIQPNTTMPSSYLTGRLRSIGDALLGLRRLVLTEPNARIHAVATILVVIAGALFRISAVEWALIALTVVCVWAAEALNTAIEALVDMVSPELQPLAARAKDVAAAAVLVAAAGSLVIALLVFGPHVLTILGR